MNWVLTNLELVEASYRLEPYVLFKAYACKALHDPLFHSTLLNILRYLARRDLGLRISTGLTRRSYWESRCKLRLRAP
jgi:precorrin-2 methylase